MINESIKNNDLVDHIKRTFSVDQYKSKVGKDENIVVVAFDVKDSDPAKDLSSFLETGHDVIDVDVSPGPDKDGYYKVFVEVERNSRLFSTIDKILNDITRVDSSATDFMFISYNNKDFQQWSKEAFDDSVYSSSYDYVIATNPEAKAVAELMEFLRKY